MIRYARCAKCKDFFVLDRLAKASCPCCTYQSFRCKDCDGAEGARRSILMHYSYWRGSRGDMAGGHELSKPAFNIQSLK